MIKKILKKIKDQTGLTLKLDDHFTGVREYKGEKYFNVKLKQACSESKEFNILENFSNEYGSIRVEPNGYKRVAIFPRL